MLIILALAAVGIGALLGRSPAPSVPPTTGSMGPTASSEADLVRVHVSGLVRSPGVVDLPAGSIVADAIDAAGGLRSDADLSSLNLAAAVGDGDLVLVPGPGVETSTGPAAVTGGGGLVSLSTAPASELETLPGVGPVLAERIVSFREDSGGFDSVDDLLEVPGIGEAKLSAIRDLVRP